MSLFGLNQSHVTHMCDSVIVMGTVGEGYRKTPNSGFFALFVRDNSYQALGVRNTQAIDRSHSQACSLSQAC